MFSFNQSLEREFSLIQLTLHLRRYPEQTYNLAINHYEDYMNLADECTKLQHKCEALEIENKILKSSKRSICLPWFLDSKRGAS